MKALNLVNKGIRLDGNNANVWYNKGMALINLQKYHEAIRAFDKVLKIHPHDNRAREQMDLAQKKIMELCSFSPSSPENR
ncbi:tetratricopeptide repeat protein [Methanoregula sp.]|jgi:tetratricopeptide (TPR) repeat protein|uniref:tetratricopeptide repeat protein n=1 Tax=Methanoregula sp. TaxID=2052170 RepID=UPI00344BB786